MGVHGPCCSQGGPFYYYCRRCSTTSVLEAAFFFFITRDFRTTVLGRPELRLRGLGLRRRPFPAAAAPVPPFASPGNAAGVVLRPAPRGAAAARPCSLFVGAAAPRTITAQRGKKHNARSATTTRLQKDGLTSS